MMARYVIDNKIIDINDLAGFNVAGYAFEKSVSTTDKLVFRRKQQ